MYDLLIRGCTLLSGDVTLKADIATKDEKIVAIAAAGTLRPGHARVEDADGLHLLPGLVDGHVHVRDPDPTNSEDFGSATCAAAAGGVTTVFAMPNTVPPTVTVDVLHEVHSIGVTTAIVDFALVAGVVTGNAECVGELAAAGAAAFDILEPLFDQGSSWWLALFDAVARSRRRIGVSIDDATLRCAGDDITGDVEVAGLLRAVPIASHTGAAITLRQLTTARELDAVASILRLYPDADVVVETCPQYLFLSAEIGQRLGARAKMIPPLRGATDQDALWVALRRQRIDYVATDHAPHDPARKAVPEADAPPGVVGLETMLPLMLTAVGKGRIRLQDVVRVCCEAPARAYGLYPSKGALAVGSDADMILVDTDEYWTYEPRSSFSRGAESPFGGWSFRGRPIKTFVRGRLVMDSGAICSSPTGRDVGINERIGL